MKLFGAIIMLVAVAAQVSLQSRESAATASGPSEQQVKQAYDDYADAMRRADLTLLDQVVADGAMFIAEHRHHTVTKSELLKLPVSVSAEASPPPALEDVEVRVFGPSAAVLSGHEVTTFRSTRGDEVRRPLRVSVTFVRGGGRWQLAAMHTSSAR